MEKLGLRPLCLLILVLWALVATPVRAERLEDIPNPKVRDNTRVTDLTGTLRPETVQRLNAIIDGLERGTTAEVAVVVVRSLDGRPIEDFAAELFKRWGIGKRGADNGLLFLWATAERRVRIEVGYGLEGVLPDAKAGVILDHQVIPRFKAGAYDDGVLEGVQAMAAVVRKEPLKLPSVTTQSYDRDGAPLWLLRGTLFGLVGLLPVGVGILGYQQWRRYRRRRCPACGATMQRLAEVEDDALLDKAQQLEERLASVDYDVWRCPACSHHFTLRYPRSFSRYDKCPQCHHRTCSRAEETVVAATTASGGVALVTEKCAFCSYSRSYRTTIPQLSDTSSSGGGSSGGGGGSFGGGSSGGGGASRGY